MEFSVLGPLAVRAGDDEVAIGGAKRRALLTLLLLNANRVVLAERLIEDLWEGKPPDSAAGTLQSHISHLRRALGPDRLITRGPGYVLEVADGELDAAVFEAELAEGRLALGAGDVGGAVAALTRALGRWRGTPFDDAAGADWATTEAARLDEARLVATETLLEARLMLGAHAEVVGEAEAAVSTHPLRERLWGLLMLALYRDGRQAEALRAYQRVRTHLGEELGIEPSAELRELEQQMLSQDPALVAPAPPIVEVAPPARLLPSGVVTFLLTDVVGSTRLWETASHAMPDALHAHDGVIGAAVEAHDGVLLKARGEGDSTFSVFRRASDAAAAALEAQGALGQFNWAEGCAIAVRMALHTGETLEQDGDYYGRTVNRVARLRAIANGGQVLVSHATADVIVDHLPANARLVELGPTELRDLDRPETVYLLTDASGAPSGADEPSAPERPPLPSRLVIAPGIAFVGRSAERDLLARRLKEVDEGARRVVLFAGEPGIGKTALATEFATAAHAAGATVLYGRCDEDLGVPYQPWIEAFGHLAAHPSPAVRGWLETKSAGELARLVPAVAESARASRAAAGDSETERWLAFGGAVAALTAAGEDAPVVVVLDDLHWADKGTLLLLRHVVDAVGLGRLLLLATYRHSDVAADHPLADALAALRHDPAVERLALEGLGDQDLVALLESSAGHELDERAVDVAHAVRRETAGNPFFVGEILRHLFETGAVSPEAGRWEARADVAGLALPDSVREVVGRRVARLGSEAEQTLATAAVIGRDFDLGLLAAAVERPEDQVLEVLERAEAAALVRTIAPGTFSFAHALIAHTLEAGLTATRRARAHRRVAEAIEELPDADERAAELARHWAAATAPSDIAKAVDYAQEAARQALRALSPDEAVRWYGQALDLLAHQPYDDERLRCELLVRLGGAQRRAGEPGFRETLLEAAALAQQLGDTDQLVRAALANNRGLWSSAGAVDTERVAVLEAALDALGADDSAARARLLATLAAELAWSNEVARRKAISDEALALARRLGDEQTLMQVLLLRYSAIWIPELLEERIAAVAEATALAEASGGVIAKAWAGMLGFMAAVETADLATIDVALDRYLVAAAQTGMPIHRWTGAMYQLSRALLAGDLERAEQFQVEVATLSDYVAPGEEVDAGNAHIIRWQQGRLAEAIEAAREVGSRFTDPLYWRARLALVCFHAGERDEASDLIDQVTQSGLLEGRGVVSWLGTTAIAAEVVAVLGKVEQAAPVYDALLPFADRAAANGPFFWTTTAHALGVLATILERFDDAEAHFIHAEHVAERLQAPFHLSRAHLEWGRMLLRRREAGDRERGIELIEKALDRARQYGCGGVERDAVAVLASPAAQPDPPPVPSNLPAERTTFVGREEELEAVAGMVRSARVVTLTGVGGVGKTRLAIQTAAQIASDFPDGVWLVELAPLIDAALVPNAVAAAVGAPPSPGVEPNEVVRRFLEHRRALVILDNCEHVIDAAAALVDRLATAAPDAQVLATSREPLDVVGESVWRVPSLSVDAHGRVGDAVALFAERATRVRLGFALDAATAPWVEAVCRRLDGIPLAIELAAARANVMSVEQIATRLDERFRLLTRGGRTAVPRQQTLQGAVDWSYELLTPGERELFDSLGVFAGEFDLAAAAAVAGLEELETLDLVQQLVDKSMLEVDPVRDRYRLLETLRQYAWDHLVSNGTIGVARDAHARWYLGLAGEQAARMGRSGEQVAALDRLEADYDNLRAALAHLIEERDVAAAVRLARRLIGLFNIRHPREGYGWFQQLVAVSDDLSPKTRARLLADTAYAALTVGDVDAVARMAQAAVDVGGDDTPAVAHWLLSVGHLSKGECGLAAEHSRSAIAMALESGDDTTRAVATAALVQAFAQAGDESAARKLIPEALALAENLGNPTITASSHLVIAGALAAFGATTEAIDLLAHALPQADAGGPLVASDIRAAYAYLIDDADRAAEILRPALAAAREQLSGRHQLPPLASAAKWLLWKDDRQTAARLFGALGNLGTGADMFALVTGPFGLSAGVGVFGYEAESRIGVNNLVDELRAAMGEREFEEQLRRGAELSVTEALQLAEDALYS